jgi:hypothetical protein
MYVYHFGKCPGIQTFGFEFNESAFRHSHTSVLLELKFEKKNFIRVG